MIATKIENAASRKCNFVSPLISSKKNALENVPSLSCQHMWIQTIIIHHHTVRWIRITEDEYDSA